LRNDTKAYRLRVWREVLNTIGIYGVEWTPYAERRTQRIIPAWVHDSQASWNAVCPLLCFPIVEWHQVDRVMRQFGGLQHIPTAPLSMDDMHVRDGRFGRGSGIRRICMGFFPTAPFLLQRSINGLVLVRNDKDAWQGRHMLPQVPKKK
ncbi:hypothetical protein PIB30_101565, partial [Stylosanthes scabra]|nr:hypothetical protein [Stylosanthes scabra]